jgi:hypothetical protein
MFVDLKGEWWNVDQIAKIEPYRPQGAGWDNAPPPPTEIVYVVTLSSGHQRGVTKEEFTRIVNISSRTP